MNSVRGEIEDEAIGWVIRVRDPAFDDWDSFTVWLEAHPDNATAYDTLALADADFDAIRVAAQKETPRAANDDEPPTFARRRVIGWGIAASLLGAIGYTSLNLTPTTYVVSTAKQEHRTVQLADGSRIDLNASTRLVLDRDNPRFARLDGGEAMFTVVHDAKRPFIVEVGGAKLMDAGTAFNVIQEKGRTEVSVSEGLVIYNPQSDRVGLPAGRRLRATSGHIAVANFDVQAAASWRQGRLVYDDAPLSLVAADISRNLGVAVSADRVAGARRFSGVIQLEGGAEAVIRSASGLAGVRARLEGGQWILSAEGDAQR